MKTTDWVDNGGTLCGVPGASASAATGARPRQHLTQYARDDAAAGIH